MPFFVVYILRDLKPVLSFPLYIKLLINQHLLNLALMPNTQWQNSFQSKRVDSGSIMDITERKTLTFFFLLACKCLGYLHTVPFYVVIISEVSSNHTWTFIWAITALLRGTVCINVWVNHTQTFIQRFPHQSAISNSAKHESLIRCWVYNTRFN